MVRTVCPGLGVLKFKYLAAPTRRTTVTTVGTGLSNHCLHRATSSISSTLSFPQLLTVVLDRYYFKTLTLNFSISSVQFLQSVCLQPTYPVLRFLYCACLFIM